jgi:hypothetical protein
VKKPLMVLGVLVVCLPMAFVGWLLLAARWTKMDASTMRMPMGMRQMVAEVAMQKVQWGKDDVGPAKRVIRLDPDSADGWHRLCTLPNEQDSKHAVVEICQKAVKLNDVAWTEDSLGEAEMADGNPCAAEDVYTRAAGMNSTQSMHDREMGHAALLCGHLPAARAGFEAALAIDEKDMKGREKDPDADDVRTNITFDHQYMSIFWARQGDAAKAREECLLTVTGIQQSCTCGFGDKGGVSCTGGNRTTTKLAD